MPKTVLPPALFPPISYMSVWVCEDVAWNVERKFEKRSWRNRYRILGPNGAQDMSAQINHQSDKSTFSSVELDHKHDWVGKEWKSIETAYRNAAFFEALAPELEPIVTHPHLTLLERCEDAMKWVLQQLQLSTAIESSGELPLYPELMKPSEEFSSISYRQVFASKHGFVGNLSVLDLLMNEGPLAYDLLVEQYALLSKNTEL